TSGRAIRMYEFVRLMARHHEVSILGFGNGDTVAVLSRLCAGVHAVPEIPFAGPARRIAQLASVWSRNSFYGRCLRSVAMQKTLDPLCDTRRFDIIQVETSQLATALHFKPAWRVVLDEHDIGSELIDSMARTDRSLLRRFYNRQERRKFVHEEVAIWRRVSAV